MKPLTNILYMPGTNCHVETIRAFRTAGAEVRLIFLRDLLDGRDRLDSADLVCLPGGFSFGDHLGGGFVASIALRTRLESQLRTCQERLMLCICNGFQIAVRAGCFGQGLALGVNASGTFHDCPNQVHVVDTSNSSPWLAGLGGMELIFPCAHGEGRFLYKQRGLWEIALRYPPDANPDGSMDGIAGITSYNGRMLGVMNHPERALNTSNILEIFSNGVKAARG